MSERSSFTRRQLYDLVWNKSVEKLAAEFGISGRGLGKLCERYGIPVPPRGYWARKAAGQRVVRPPLIEIPSLNREPTITFSLPAPRSSATDEQSKHSVDPYAEMWAQQIEAIGPLSVPQKLSSHPHPIISRWLEEDRIQREHARAMRGNGYFPLRFDTPLERRKLRILDVVMKTLEAMGLKVEHDARRGPGITVRANYDAVEFTIAEHIRQIRRRLTPEEKADRWRANQTWTVEREPTGKFVLKILGGWALRSVPSSFQEGDDQLEHSLHKFVAALIAFLARARESRENRAAEERRYREAQERARRLEEERQAELARKVALRAQAAAWREAALLRDYVAAVRAAVAEGNNVVPPDRVEEWAAWALDHADEIDPIEPGVMVSAKSQKAPCP
jgi:hypothetical protein